MCFFSGRRKKKGPPQLLAMGPRLSLLWIFPSAFAFKIGSFASSIARSICFRVVRSGPGFCPQVCSKDPRCSIGFLILFITASISRPLVQPPMRSLQDVLNFKIIQNSATAAMRGLTLGIHLGAPVRGLGLRGI